MASSVLQVRVDDSLRAEASKILHHLGLDLSSGVRLFLNRVVQEQGIPFPMSLKEEHYGDSFDINTYLENFKEIQD